eukprot:6391848-Amphidinium_carterae.2
MSGREELARLRLLTIPLMEPDLDIVDVERLKETRLISYETLTAAQEVRDSLTAAQEDLEVRKRKKTAVAAWMSCTQEEQAHFRRVRTSRSSVHCSSLVEC